MSNAYMVVIFLGCLDITVASPSHCHPPPHCPIPSHYHPLPHLPSPMNCDTPLIVTRLPYTITLCITLSQSLSLCHTVTLSPTLLPSPSHCYPPPCTVTLPSLYSPVPHIILHSPSHCHTPLHITLPLTVTIPL